MGKSSLNDVALFSQCDKLKKNGGSTSKLHPPRIPTTGGFRACAFK